MTSEIKQRIVYQLVRTDKPENGTDIYVGSTSRSLKWRLQVHRAYAKVSSSILHTRMVEVGIYNWKIVPLLVHICDQKAIRDFEKSWIGILNPDLNTYSPINTTNKWNNGKGKEIKRKHHYDSIENKRYYCDICDKAFGYSTGLRSHLKTLKHSYAYMNSVD